MDVEAQIEDKKGNRIAYRELLKQAKSVEEILKIEEQIDKLRAEIESTEGRLRLLKDRESYSTLPVSFYEIIRPVGGLLDSRRNNFSAGLESRGGIHDRPCHAVAVDYADISRLAGGLVVNRKTGGEKGDVDEGRMEFEDPKTDCRTQSKRR